MSILQSSEEIASADQGRDRRLPVLMVAVGRGRVGKTTFLNIVGQRFRERGANVDIWNIDPHGGDKGSIESFFPDVRRPPFSGLDDRLAWLEDAIGEQSAARRDVLLDVGGGDLVFQNMVRGLDLNTVAETMGVRVVVVQLVGPVVADLAHFDVAAVGSGPNINTLFVLNAGLIRGDTSPVRAFEAVVASDVLKAANDRGAIAAMLPQLVCLDAILESRVTFRDACDRKSPAGTVPLSIFDVARTYKWWTGGLDVMFNRIPPRWLPALPDVTGAGT